MFNHIISFQPIIGHGVQIGQQNLFEKVVAGVIHMKYVTTTASLRGTVGIHLVLIECRLVEDLR